MNAKQERIVTIAAFTANGHLEKLKAALNEGFDAGLTVNEIKEILVQMYAYAGFPRSLNGINTFMDVLEERKQKGIKDEPGKEPSPTPANRSSIELGTEIQTRLIGAPTIVSLSLLALVPAYAGQAKPASGDNAQTVEITRNGSQSSSKGSADISRVRYASIPCSRRKIQHAPSAPASRSSPALGLHGTAIRLVRP